VCTAFSLGRFSQKETSVEKVRSREEPCKREFCQAGEKAKELERTSRVRGGEGRVGRDTVESSRLAKEHCNHRQCKTTKSQQSKM